MRFAERASCVVYLHSRDGDLVVYELHRKPGRGAQMEAVVKARPHRQRSIVRSTKKRH